MNVYDKILVIDLESTCWEEDGDYQKNNSEIIEIGICKYVISTGEIEAKKSYYIKPENSEISEFCTKLTGITKKIIEKEGVSLETALKRIKNKYRSQARIWAAFGDYDRIMLEKECKKREISHPFGETYLNIRSLMTVKNKMAKGIGLTEALILVKESFDGNEHCGADDAYNTAKLLRFIL